MPPSTCSSFNHLVLCALHDLTYNQQGFGFQYCPLIIIIAWVEIFTSPTILQPQLRWQQWSSLSQLIYPMSLAASREEAQMSVGAKPGFMGLDKGKNITYKIQTQGKEHSVVNQIFWFDLTKWSKGLSIRQVCWIPQCRCQSNTSSKALLIWLSSVGIFNILNFLWY